MLPGLLVGRRELGHSQCGFLPYLWFCETSPRSHSTGRPGLRLGDGTRTMGSRGVWGGEHCQTLAWGTRDWRGFGACRTEV